MTNHGHEIPRCMPDSFAFQTAVSVNTDSVQAVGSVIEQLTRGMTQIDFAVVFAATSHMGYLERRPDLFANRLGTENIIGCTTESVIAGGREYEGEPAISAWVARLPECSVDVMHLQYDRMPDGGAFTGWPDAMLGEWPRGSLLVVLGEPLSCPADVLLARLNEDRPGIPAVGGMASAGLGSNRLLIGRKICESGVAAVRVSGDIRASTVVSQGCRPIGEPMVVTRAEANEIFQLRGQPVMECLQSLYRELPTRDQRLVNEGLQIGRVISEYQDHRQFGDYLIRGVLGHNPDNRSLCVGDFFRTGQTVQFHVRDHASADLDLRQRLQPLAETLPNRGPCGALLFTCNGRGTNLFPEPDHDASVVRKMLGELPVAGFFAAGEIGPVGGQNFLHGYTASLVVFSRATDA